MEQVGPGAPLDAQIMRLRIFKFIVLTGGAFSAPLFSSGHGTDFLQAKVSFTPAGQVRVEITANYGENPMISDHDQAASILPASLEVHLPQGPRPLHQLAPIQFEQRSEFDPTSPLPPEPVATPHQLLTACWEWQPDCDSLQFRVPQGSKHDVMLWVIDPDKTENSPKWMMLLSGETTPDIAIPARPSRQRLPWLITGFASLFFTALSWRKIRSRKG